MMDTLLQPGHLLFLFPVAIPKDPCEDKAPTVVGPVETHEKTKAL